MLATKRQPMIGAVGPAVGGHVLAEHTLVSVLFGRVALSTVLKTGFFCVGALGFVRLMWALLFIRSSATAHRRGRTGHTTWWWDDWIFWGDTGGTRCPTGM